MHFKSSASRSESSLPLETASLDDAATSEFGSVDAKTGEFGSVDAKTSEFGSVDAKTGEFSPIHRGPPMAQNPGKQHCAQRDLGHLFG